MKNIFFAAMLLMTASILAFGQTQNVVSIKYPGYTLAAPVTLQGYADAELVPFVSGKLDSLSPKAAQSRFGILYRDDVKNLSGVTFLEILDATTNKVIQKISLDELLNGKENELKLTKEVMLMNDEALPGGKKLEVSFALQSSSALKVKARLYGRVEGALVQLTNGFSISNTEPLTMLKPAILFHVGIGAPTQLEMMKKGKQQNFKLTGSSATVDPNKKTKILSFDIIGSTITFSNNVPQQMANIENYFTSKKATPNIAVITTSDKSKTSPGDTVIYTIYYDNIGTAPAQDIDLTGLVPAGTQYLGGSAEGKETTISFVRKEAKPPAQGEIISVKWNDKSIIKQGEERWVRYKVVVR